MYDSFAQRGCGVPFLEAFKARLDVALGSVVGDSACGRGVEIVVLFNSRYPMIL